MTETPEPIVILVDADACPVKAEIYRVAERHRTRVFVVSNSFLAVPQDPLIERVVVGSGFDAAAGEPEAEQADRPEQRQGDLRGPHLQPDRRLVGRHPVDGEQKRDEQEDRDRDPHEAGPALGRDVGIPEEALRRAPDRAAPAQAEGRPGGPQAAEEAQRGWGSVKLD